MPFARRPHYLAPLRRLGFTVAELLVVIACMGVLMGLLLPAVMMARESARRATCCSQMRELGIAAMTYHDRQRKFPSAWRKQPSEPNFIRGWATELLTELGEPTIEALLRQSPSAVHDLQQASLPILLCPSDITEPTFQLLSEVEEGPVASVLSSSPSTKHTLTLPMTLPTANYVGVFGTTEADEQHAEPGEPKPQPSDGTIVHDRRVRLADLQRGSSVTLLFGERTMAMVPSTWLGVDEAGEDAQCRLVGSAITSPNCVDCDECEFGSRHSGGANFLWADGHVALISDDVETALYQTYSQRFAR